MPDPKTMSSQAVPVVTVGNEGAALRFEAVQNSTQVGGADLFDNGQIPFQYAPGALVFSATSSVWYQQRELVQFCDTGWDQYFGTESGYLSTEKPGRGMTSMQLNGYPGRKLPFVVQSLGLFATLPYTPTVASGSATSGSGPSVSALAVPPTVVIVLSASPTHGYAVNCAVTTASSV